MLGRLCLHYIQCGDAFSLESSLVQIRKSRFDSMKNEIKNEATNMIAKCPDSEVVELQNQNVNKFWENETKWNME